MSVMRRPRDTISTLIPRRVKIYDVTEKKLLGVFETTILAAKFCGMKHNSCIYHYIKSKTRYLSPLLNKIICFR